MKKTFFLTVALFLGLIIGVQAQTSFSGSTGGNAFTIGTDQIKWNKTEHDFGSIPANQPVQVEFTVTNNSMMPLIISNVKTTCGCTVPTYSTDPILPGKSTVIKAEYNAKAIGSFVKTITVSYNTDAGSQALTLTGTVTQ